MEELEQIIGYTFQNKKLLKQALTHSSYANEKKLGKLGCNERLEFLGDAVLELVSSDFLYARFPQIPEGELNQKESQPCVRAEPCLLCETVRTPEIPSPWTWREHDRRTKQRFYRIRCDRGTPWRDLP